MDLNYYTPSHQVRDEHLNRVDWINQLNQPGQNKSKELRIVLDPYTTFQTIEGLAASFNEIGSEALFSLPEGTRDTVADTLFGEAAKPVFHWGRIPLGASDFALDAYSFSEVSDDYSQEHFSLERDKNCLMKFINLAAERNPHFRLHASPWSPPAWMKTSREMDNGENNPGTLSKEPAVRKAYAIYLRKALEGYSQEGFPIKRLVVQNEPDSPAPFPGCVMTPQDMIDFVNNYLAPEFRDNHVESEIWAGTFRTVTGLQAHSCMKDMEFKRNVSGCAFQYTNHKYVSQFRELYPKIPVIHSESVCHNGDNSEAEAIYLLHDVIAYFEAGVSLYTYWNMILNETSKSTWGWKQNSLITINRRTHEVTYNPDFEVMAMLSRQAVPGSKRIQSFCFSLPVLAVQKPNNAIGIIFYNNREERKVVVEIENKEFPIDIPGYSIVSLSIGLDHLKRVSS